MSSEPKGCVASPLTIIAGMCVIEGEEIFLGVGRELKSICDDLGFDFVLKGSFDKANRTSVDSYRGPGIDRGLDILRLAKERLGVRVTTDVHTVEQVARVASTVDIIQVPAFLCRQTDLLTACGESGLPVNVKKGQFLSGDDMAHVVAKLRSAGAVDVTVTERGTTFGYNNLVSDMRNLVTMRQEGVSVCFDATHSVQRPGAAGGASGGDRELAAPLARAAVAVGVNALFFEVHPNPSEAKSDSATAIKLSNVSEFLRGVAEIHQIVSG